MRAPHGVAGADGVSAVRRLNLRDQKEAILEFAVLITQRKILLVLLHRKNQAFFRHGKEFLVKAGVVYHGPFSERSHFVHQILRHDDFSIKTLSGVFEFLNHLVSSFVKRRNNLGGFHFFDVALGARNFDRRLAVEAMSARFSAGLETEEFNIDNLIVKKRD